MYYYATSPQVALPLQQQDLDRTQAEGHALLCRFDLLGSAKWRVTTHQWIYPPPSHRLPNRVEFSHLYPIYLAHSLLVPAENGKADSYLNNYRS